MTETETEVVERLHSAEVTSKILGGVVTANWLAEHINELWHTRLGRSIGFTDDNIARNLAENCFDSSGRKVDDRKPR